MISFDSAAAHGEAERLRNENEAQRRVMAEMARLAEERVSQLELENQRLAEALKLAGCAIYDLLESPSSQAISKASERHFRQILAGIGRVLAAHDRAAKGADQ